ncbi:hypothetical protein ACQKCU_25140 [Heyndrickxia sporothermodurans]
MVTVSVQLNTHMFIFPEIVAMVFGMWVFRVPNWLRNPLKICIAPSITSVIGFSMNQLQVAYMYKVGITLILMIIFLRLIQSNFAPSLATGLLPLITNSHEWTLVLWIFILTFILMLLVIFFRLDRNVQKKKDIDYKYSYIFLFLTLMWLGVCRLFGFEHLAIIPPILVVIYEALQKNEYSGKLACKQGIALTISGSIGTFFYLIMDSWIMITIISLGVMFFFSKIMDIRMPAVYAFPLLSFILPIEMVLKLPLASFFTCLFLFITVAIYKKYEMLTKTKNLKSSNVAM